MKWLLAAVLVLLLSLPAHADIKVIVDVGLSYFANDDVRNTPNPGGTQLCVKLDLYPYNSTTIARVTECASRTAAAASNICTFIKNRLIARAALAPFFANVTEEEIDFHGKCSKPNP
jgi:hypothetical protein